VNVTFVKSRRFGADELAANAAGSA